MDRIEGTEPLWWSYEGPPGGTRRLYGGRGARRYDGSWPWVVHGFPIIGGVQRISRTFGRTPKNSDRYGFSNVIMFVGTSLVVR